MSNDLDILIFLSSIPLGLYMFWIMDPIWRWTCDLVLEKYIDNTIYDLIRIDE